MLTKTILEPMQDEEDKAVYISQAFEEIYNYKILRMKVDEEYKSDDYRDDVIESLLEIIEYIKE